MRHHIALIAALAAIAGPIALPAAAQDAQKPRTAQVTVQKQGQGTAATGRAQPRGCGQDSFGARVCDDGTNFPGGPFGTRPAKKAPAAGTGQGAAPAAAPAPDPARVIRNNAAAEDGNLYGTPGGGQRGQDAYGCRTDENGQVVCD